MNSEAPSANPRSTVATTTEIYDYFRLLFARVGTPHCWVCGKEIASQHSSQIVDWIIARPKGTKVQICAPLIRGKKGEHKDIFASIQREGFVRVRVDGGIYDIPKRPALDKNKKHDIAAVVDRLVINEAVRIRLADSVETALKLGDGVVVVLSQKPDAANDRMSKMANGERYTARNSPARSIPRRRSKNCRRGYSALTAPTARAKAATA